MLLDRQTATRLGRETLSILEAGRYTTSSGVTVDIVEPLARAVAESKSYPPDARVELPGPGRFSTVLEVRNESTLAAARRLCAEGLVPVALNFASGTHPGGGFLSGARAQEESLARSSGLHACLQGQPMYEHHKRHRDAMYTSWAIYSPLVPVFRDDSGALLESPYLCSFITAPAPNAKSVLADNPSAGPALRAALEERIPRVLAIACRHNHTTIVLGAWGCGAFGNDSNTVAELFARALGGPFRGAFEHVCFAILDWSPDQRFIGPFRRRLEGPSA